MPRKLKAAEQAAVSAEPVASGRRNSIMVIAPLIGRLHLSGCLGRGGGGKRGIPLSNKVEGRGGPVPSVSVAVPTLVAAEKNPRTVARAHWTNMLAILGAIKLAVLDHHCILNHGVPHPGFRRSRLDLSRDMWLDDVSPVMVGERGHVALSVAAPLLMLQRGALSCHSSLLVQLIEEMARPRLVFNLDHAEATSLSEARTRSARPHWVFLIRRYQPAWCISSCLPFPTSSASARLLSSMRRSAPCSAHRLSSAPRPSGRRTG